MTLKKYKEVLIGCMMLIVSVVYLVAATSIRVRTQSSFDSRLIPIFLGVAILVLGIIQITSGYRAAKTETVSPRTAEENDDAKQSTKAVLAIFGIIIIYIALLRPVGFLVSTTCMMFAQMMVLSPKNKRNPVMFAVLSIGVSAIIYFSFRTGLRLMLPSGILG